MPAICGIYMLRNTVNGRVYVGQSVDVYARWKEHCKAARRGHKSYLYDSMRKHGVVAFELVVLEQCVATALDAREAYWMDHYQCHDETKGYNYRPAGQGTQAMTPLARARISARLKGKKMSPERVEQMRQISTGKPCSAEARKKISAFHKGICVDAEARAAIKQEIAATHPKPVKEKKRVLRTDSYKTPEFRQAVSERFAGKPKSEETKEKMRESRKNEPPEVRARRIAVLSAVTKARWAKWREEKAKQCSSQA